MRYIRFAFLFLIAGFCMLLANSCSSCHRQQSADEITIDIADLAIDSSHINMAQQVFYALPTPIEVSLLIKNSGITYQSTLLNDPSNASQYLTNSKMALNFGVYITDLTYAGLFEQAQTMLQYKQAIMKLTDGLGMQAAIDQNIMRQLESSINNREEMLRIISDAYASCTAYLSEDDRYFLTVAILAGGWIEGMYIATSLTNENLASIEDRMKQLVVDQKLTFDLMWEAMSSLEHISDIAGLMREMSDLARIFNEINVEQTPNQVIYDTESKSTELEASAVNNITPELYAEVKMQIQVLRNNFIKNI